LRRQRYTVKSMKQLSQITAKDILTAYLEKKKKKRNPDCVQAVCPEGCCDLTLVGS